MLFIKMQMPNIHMMHMFSFQRCNSWCKCLMQGWRYEVYSWWRQRTYLPVMHMSPYRDEDAKCLVMQMISNGYVGMPWCKCPLVGMSWCKCTLVGVSWCQCTLVGVPWCKCTLIGVPWCKCALVGVLWCQCTLVGVPWCRYTLVGVQMYPWEYAMMRMSSWCMPPWECHGANAPLGMPWCKCNLFKNFLYFQNEASAMLETKIFSNSIYYSWKVIFLLT